jgi:hypothetical protein
MPAEDALAPKLWRFLAGSAAFLALLVALYTAHMRWLPVEVVFYAALQDVLACVLLAALALWRLRAFAPFNAFEKLQVLLGWALIGYCLAISLPTVIDRSLSFYILEKVQQRGGGLRADRFEKVFTQEYVREHRLIDVRLTEQLASGTVVLREGCVLLTPRGDRLAHFSRFFRRHFLPRHRFLLGQPSDALLDPLRGSAGNRDGACSADAPEGDSDPKK